MEEQKNNFSTIFNIGLYVHHIQPFVKKNLINNCIC